MLYNRTLCFRAPENNANANTYWDRLKLAINSNSTIKVGGVSNSASDSNVKSIHNGPYGSRPHQANSVVQAQDRVFKHLVQLKWMKPAPCYSRNNRLIQDILRSYQS